MRSHALVLFLACIPFFPAAAAGGKSGGGRIEQPVPGCQDLESRRPKPIRLKGKLFVTYLPDGRRYNKHQVSAPPDYFELGVLDLEKPWEGIRRLTSDTLHDAEVRVSPDGKKIVWSKRPLLDSFDDENTILIANADMTDVKVLAHATDAYLGIPSFSKPAGDLVLFSRQGSHDSYTKLMTASLTTGRISEFRTSFKGGIADPQMSRDGKWITFKSQPSDADDAQIFLMKADGTGVRRLTRNDYKVEDPAFSPDGRLIAFERMWGPSTHKGQVEGDWYFKEGIVVYDLRTAREKALTEPDPCGKNELWLPTWSPDGAFIMMTRGLHLENGDFTHDLWVMRKDGSDLQRVPGSEGIMFFDWVK